MTTKVEHRVTVTRHASNAGKPSLADLRRAVNAAVAAARSEGAPADWQVESVASSTYDYCTLRRASVEVVVSRSEVQR